MVRVDGKVEHWQVFKTNVCRLCDEKDWAWLIEGANVLSDHLQVTVAAMTATSKRSTGAGVDAELADVIFPVRTATDELYAIDTTGSQAGSTLLVERTKDTILSLAVLLKANFKVDFAVGTKEDPSFGGTLRTPEGHTINLMFRDNLWHVPMWRTPLLSSQPQGPQVSFSM